MASSRRCKTVLAHPVLVLTLSKSFVETFAIQMTHPGEISGLGFDTTNNRLCVCTRNDIVQSWSILKDPMTGKWTAQNIFSIKYPNLSLQAVMFDAFHNSKDRDIIAFGLHNNGPVSVSVFVLNAFFLTLSPQLHPPWQNRGSCIGVVDGSQNVRDLR